MFQRQEAARMARRRTLPSPLYERHGRPQEAAVVVKERRLHQYEGVHPSLPVVTIGEHPRKLQVLRHLQQKQRLRLLQSRVSQEERTKSTNQGKDAEEEALAREVMQTNNVDAEALPEDAIEIAREKKRTIVGQVEIVVRDLKRNESRHEAAGMTVPGLTETEIVKAIEVMAEEKAEHTRVLPDAEPTRVRPVIELSWLALS